MTLDQLNQVGTHRSRPIDTLDDNTWQQMFQVLKMKTTPSVEKKMTCKPVGGLDRGSDGNETEYYRYRAYINDVLKEIRSGRHDYCYYEYQIKDLLKYEHDRLRTRYISDGKYFDVWLEIA